MVSSIDPVLHKCYTQYHTQIHPNFGSLRTVFAGIETPASPIPMSSLTASTFCSKNHRERSGLFPGSCKDLLAVGPWATHLLISPDLSLLISTIGIMIPLQAPGLLWGSDAITQQIALTTFQRAQHMLSLQRCTKRWPSFLWPSEGPLKSWTLNYNHNVERLDSFLFACKKLRSGGPSFVTRESKV